jgi:hypothetical protein
MSHFAQVINGIVEQVIVAEQDFINTLPDSQNWIQTSYNTRGGVHYGANENPDGGIALRGNYASIGGIYDAQNDVFYSQRPLDMNNKICQSWTIGAPNWTWNPPIPQPPLIDNGYINTYLWNEDTKEWTLESSIKAPITTGVQNA